MSAYTFYMWTSLPFLLQGPIIVYFTTGRRIFPHLLVFPFAAFEVIAYTLVWLWIIFAHCSHVIAMVCNDFVIYGIVNVTALEFEILREKFKCENDKHDCIHRHNELHAIFETLQKILHRF